MTEPVGNARRGDAPLPGSNSHAARAAAEKAAGPLKAPEEREPIESIVHGKVVQKKPNVFKRAARGMVADDVTNVGDFVLTDVLMPAVRNLIYVDDNAEAMDVLENLVARVDRYGSASVADFYDYLGVTGGFTDQAYGWKNLSAAQVRQTRKGYTFDLPRPIALR